MSGGLYWRENEVATVPSFYAARTVGGASPHVILGGYEGTDA